MKTPIKLVAALSFALTLLQSVHFQAQEPTPDIAAIQAKITAERSALRRAISSHDEAVVRKYLSPDLVANAPTNTVVSRAQIIAAMNHGGLNYSVESTPEYFTVTNGTAILMSRDIVVPTGGRLAGKHLVRRSTDIYQRSGEDWLLVANQGTYVGFDANPTHEAGADFTPPAATPETDAVRAQIVANDRAVGHAIGIMDFAALEKLWSPEVVVNSPGNVVLTRDKVFKAMREDKLKYSSYKTSLDAFVVHNDLAIEMGQDDVVMSNGPMSGKPLSRRAMTVWQKTGDQWLMIARQATYVGIDGGAAYGHPDPSLEPVSLNTPGSAAGASGNGSQEDVKATEAIVHSNPSDHVTEDVSFTNIFGTVRFGREEFIERHKQIGQTFFKGTTSKSTITKLRFVRPDVAVVDVAGELSGFQKTYPGLPVGTDGILRNKLLLVLVKEDGIWWITEFHNVAQTPEI